MAWASSVLTGRVVSPGGTGKSGDVCIRPTLRTASVALPPSSAVSTSRRQAGRAAERSSRITTDFEVGVLLTSATESSGTRTFASGK